MKTKATSNLNFVQDMEVELTLSENKANLKFSTGFEAECILFNSVNGIDIYTYPSRNGETHFLHVRKVDNELFCQTVQTGTSPGGSTFRFTL
jgi:hypothetical protein